MFAADPEAHFLFRAEAVNRILRQTECPSRFWCPSSVKGLL